MSRAETEPDDSHDFLKIARRLLDTGKPVEAYWKAQNAAGNYRSSEEDHPLASSSVTPGNQQLSEFLNELWESHLNETQRKKIQEELKKRRTKP